MKLSLPNTLLLVSILAILGHSFPTLDQVTSSLYDQVKGYNFRDIPPYYLSPSIHSISITLQELGIRIKSYSHIFEKRYPGGVLRKNIYGDLHLWYTGPDGPEPAIIDLLLQSLFGDKGKVKAIPKGGAASVHVLINLDAIKRAGYGLEIEKGDDHWRVRLARSENLIEYFVTIADDVDLRYEEFKAEIEKPQTSTHSF